MRNFSITKNHGELHEVKVVDSYGNKYKNWFNLLHECNDWIYYIWENEKPKLTKKQQDYLLYNAIEDCKKIDKSNNITKIM